VPAAAQPVGVYLVGWSEQDWQRMANVSSRIWRRAEPDPVMVIADQYDFRELQAAALGRVDADGRGHADVWVAVWYRAAGQDRNEWIVFRTQHETQLGEVVGPDLSASWAVHPLASLRTYRITPALPLPFVTPTASPTSTATPVPTVRATEPIRRTPTVVVSTPTARTPTRTATALPTLTIASSASPIATRTPTTAPTPVGVTITQPPGVLRRNATATVGVRTAPGVLCSIVVKYKSGRSVADGLGDKTTNAGGDASWSWKVGGNTTPGTWSVTITCGGQSASTVLTVPG
jgi:hypothetical protein